MKLRNHSILNDRYEIESCLGAGGFGVTYSAWDHERNRRVAIKENYPSYLVVRDSGGAVILRGDRKSFDWAWRHFTKEADLLSTLKHPNIVKGYGTFEQNNTVYFVMEYLEGTPLSEYCRPNAWTEQSLRELLVKLLDALRYMQRRHVCHRDIKPANVMVRHDGSPVLIDFGAAKEVKSYESYSCGFMSSGYTPPEQIADHNCLDSTIDVYALGATMYTLLTGAPPPPVPNRQLRDSYSPLVDSPSLLRRFSRSFLSTIDAALVLDPTMRTQSAAQWLTYLRKETVVEPTKPSTVPFSLFSKGKSKPRNISREYDSQEGGYSDSGDEIPLPMLLGWIGNISLLLGGLLFLGIISTFFSGGASHVLDGCWPVVLILIIVGLLARYFSNQSD